MNVVRKVDNGIMQGLSWATSTKTAFYALTVLIIVAVAVNPPTTIQGWLLVAVSEFYQGVALPGLGSASKRAEDAAKHEGEITRKLLQETHDAAMSEFREIRQMHEELREENRQLRGLVAEMRQTHIGLVEIVQKHVGGG